jgi:hypothetical protein
MWSLLFLSDFNQNQSVFISFSKNRKYYGNLSGGRRAVAYGQTDRLTDGNNEASSRVSQLLWEHD